MIQNICLFILIISLASCARRLPGDADLNITPFENFRTYNLPKDQVLAMIAEKLTNYLLSISSTIPKAEIIRHYVPKKPRNMEYTEVQIIVTRFKPKEPSFTACRGGYRRQGESIWSGGDRGLDHGMMKITITPIDKQTTRVIVQTSFIEIHEVTRRGEITGFSEGSIGTYNAYGTQYSAKKVDVGSTCYSTGIIETSVLNLIKGNTAISPKEKWVFEERFPIESNSYQISFQEMKNKIMDANDLERKNAGVNMLENANANAKFYYNLSDSNRYTKDATNLGILYVTGQEVEKNELMAFKLFEKAAALKKSQRGTRLNQWKAIALYNLGVMYERGIGTNINKSKALELFNQSADSGNLDAQCKLGYLYHYGLLGLKKDKIQAASWLVIAALTAEIKKDIIPNYALRNLGYIYKHGLGVTKNSTFSYVFYNMAAMHGDAEAQILSYAIRQNLSGAQLKQATLFRGNDKLFFKRLKASFN